MMAANYRHIGCLENRLGRHYSRFSASGPAAPLAVQSLARRKSPNHGSNRRSQASVDQLNALIETKGLLLHELQGQELIDALLKIIAQADELQGTLGEYGGIRRIR